MTQTNLTDLFLDQHGTEHQGMYNRILDCVFTAAFDPGADANEAWIAFKVYRDGVPIELDRFASEEEADECAMQEMNDELEQHGQFGVGA